MMFVLGFISGAFICLLNALLIVYLHSRHQSKISRVVNTVEKRMRGKAVIYEPDEEAERLEDVLRKKGDEGLDVRLDDDL